MDQAAWNLCPVSGVASGTACYYADDQTFTELSGSTTVVIDDCPDGARTVTPFILAPVLALLPFLLFLLGSLPGNAGVLIRCVQSTSTNLWRILHAS